MFETKEIIYLVMIIITLKKMQSAPLFSTFKTQKLILSVLGHVLNFTSRPVSGPCQYQDKDVIRTKGGFQKGDLLACESRNLSISSLHQE